MSREVWIGSQPAYLFGAPMSASTGADMFGENFWLDSSAGFGKPASMRLPRCRSRAEASP
jgi:hypothetical protein